MAFWNRKQEITAPKEERAVHLGGLLFGATSSYGESTAMKIAAVNSATNQISNSVGLLPIKVFKTKGGKKVEVKDHYLNKILNLRPHPKFGHFAFFKKMVESCILKGNGYAYIERDEMLQVKALHFINPDFVTPMVQEDGTVKYIVAGMTKAIDDYDMINLNQHLDDQYNGISVLKYAALALGLAMDTGKQADKFFKSGGNLSGIIKAAATLTNEQKAQIRTSWQEAFSSDSDKVGVAILPQGLDYQPISISPEDSQLLDFSKFTVIEIARFFNISPIKLMDLQEVSYSSMESTQLYYLQDTIMPYVEALENELNYKLFKPSEVGKYIVDFDFDALMATNRESLANYYHQLLVNGIMTPNEVREKMGLSPDDSESMNKFYMQLSYTTLDNIASGVLTNQSQTVNEDQSNMIDNKVKNNKE